MAAAWVDHDAGHGLERELFAVEFDGAFAFQHDVDLGHPFVVVGLRVRLDVDDVDRGGLVLRRGKGAA